MEITRHSTAACLAENDGIKNVLTVVNSTCAALQASCFVSYSKVSNHSMRRYTDEQVNDKMDATIDPYTQPLHANYLYYDESLF